VGNETDELEPRTHGAGKTQAIANYLSPAMIAVELFDSTGSAL
jgi:hypothetical protein